MYPGDIFAFRVSAVSVSPGWRSNRKTKTFLKGKCCNRWGLVFTRARRGLSYSAKLLTTSRVELAVGNRLLQQDHKPVDACSCRERTVGLVKQWAVVVFTRHSSGWDISVTYQALVMVYLSDVRMTFHHYHGFILQCSPVSFAILCWTATQYDVCLFQ